MVNVKDMSVWNVSISMIIGISPKIEYICGKCGSYNTARISMESIKIGKPYVVCKLCYEINDTKLILK